MQKPKDNTKALAAFIARNQEIDSMLSRIAALSGEHFSVGPENVNWAHVGTLEYYAELLKQITDAAFHEGEHAD